MKKLLASTILAAGLFGYAGSASAQECGTVTIANMNWPSAEALANLDKTHPFGRLWLRRRTRRWRHSPDIHVDD